MATIHAPTLASETITHIGSFGIRNTLLMAWITMTLLILLALAGKLRGYRLVPGRFQAFLEVIVEGLFDLFDGIMQDRGMTRKVFPLVATFFLFIIIANWLGIIPGVGSITVEALQEGELIRVPLLRSMNADANVTLAFTLISVIGTQIIGITSIGMLSHIGKYFVFPWKKPYIIGTFVGILEFIGEFARLASFTFRLFGNIFAGEVLLIVISFLVPWIVPIPFLGLEVFVGFIQALVFCMLTLSFMKLSTEHHGDEEHQPQGGEAHA